MKLKDEEVRKRYQVKVEDTYIHTFPLHFINPISAHQLLDMKHVIISVSMTDTDKKHKQQYHSTTSHTVQAIQYNTKMQKIYKSKKVKGKK
jgi:hypothetical protein